MTGFQLPASGEVLLGDKVISTLTPHWIRRHGIARTFQAGRLFREMPVSENVEVAAISMGLSRKKAHAHAMELLDWLGLAEQAKMPAGILPYTDERRVGKRRIKRGAPGGVQRPGEAHSGNIRVCCDSEPGRRPAMFDVRLPDDS